MSKKTLQQDIKAKEGLIVSTDTLKIDDLLTSCYTLITNYNLKTDIKKQIEDCFEGIPTNYNYFYSNCKLLADKQEDAEYLFNETIFNYFNSVCPNNYYFGNTEGDGACFGFFMVTDEDY